MPASTPIARSKTAALARVLDVIPKGYYRYTQGIVSASKAESLARKFHLRYGIGSTPAQRVTKRKRGLVNALLVMYWPDGCQQVEWLMLATDGQGMDGEKLRDIAGKPRLAWLEYELARRPERGRTVWTWRRPAEEMAEHYALIAEFSNKRHVKSLGALLQRLANQPGFHGVREQSKRLFEEARRRGHAADLPHLFYVQKVSHGEGLRLG
ncbi:hypothetical protein DIE21_32780 [Burkholderia sp. Bp9140]|uniref:hypothetical protein n=1 Tax=Burkholderia sp. Bp9140 TaxID=2184572 RepID=UPI000F58B590|nr:hypothetical protein [Burkholderia sp. Bp9140]RQR44806.1 hypothetical protein DIE21_32780 [Burkholderia sp. Bp9140]